jgi:hypothetical protein
MDDAIQFHSHVGADGVLDVHVELGRGEERDVVVTIQPLASGKPEISTESWQEFIESTYGSCAGLGLERPDQGILEERDPIE